METGATTSLSSVLKNDVSLSEYFTNQFINLTPWKILIGLLIGCLVGLIIAFVYKRCYRGVLYSPTFALTLMMLTLITTPVVMCIKSDIALSMGMVGALSIVRFRTAVKDPMDTAYMFWALTMGILLGAELYVHALMVVLVISVHAPRRTVRPARGSRSGQPGSRRRRSRSEVGGGGVLPDRR
jgi:NhaP-type Na+/H+ or K+/H+ antiporter